MKLSSISFIAAALAATAGNAVAVPRPLYTRSLEPVNSFQRDLDIHRREPGVAPTRYVEAGKTVRASASVHRQAAAMAEEASKKAPGSWTGRSKQKWIEIGQQLTAPAMRLLNEAQSLERGKAPQDLKTYLKNVASDSIKAEHKATLAHHDIQGDVRDRHH